MSSRSDRLRALARLLLQEPEHTTIKCLAETLGVSARTIQSDLSSPELARLISPATLVKKPNRGIRLEASPAERADALRRLRASASLPAAQALCDSDLTIIELLRTQDPLSRSGLTELLHCSEQAVERALEVVSSRAEQQGLAVERTSRGRYLLSGNEDARRALFLTSLQSSSVHSGELAEPAFTAGGDRLLPQTWEALVMALGNDERSHRLVDLVEVCETSMNTRFVNQDYNRIVLELAIQLVRVQLGQTVGATFGDELERTPEYYYAMLLKAYIDRVFNIELPDSEVAYTAQLIMRARTQTSEQSSPLSIELLEKFIRSLSVRLNIDFTRDFELKARLIDHIKPAIRRVQHDVVSENPLLQQIRDDFTEVYIAVITTIEDLEFMGGFHFDSNEIGFICLHIVAAVSRAKNVRHIRGALICGEGLSVEVYLKSIIESYFTELAIVDVYNEETLRGLVPSQYDLIINSTHHAIEGKTVACISPQFSKADFSTVKDALERVLRRAAGIQELSRLDRVEIHRASFSSREQLVRHYCDQLVEAGCVQPEYFSSVMERIKTASTYVARGIALPHGAKAFVLRSNILIIQLEQPIDWDDEQADLVILVSISEAEARDMGALFRKIMRIAASDEMSLRLKSCRDLDDLTGLLAEA